MTIHVDRERGDRDSECAGIGDFLRLGGARDSAQHRQREAKRRRQSRQESMLYVHTGRNTESTPAAILLAGRTDALAAREPGARVW